MAIFRSRLRTSSLKEGTQQAQGREQTLRQAKEQTKRNKKGSFFLLFFFVLVPVGLQRVGLPGRRPFFSSEFLVSNQRSGTFVIPSKASIFLLHFSFHVCGGTDCKDHPFREEKRACPSLWERQGGVEAESHASFFNPHTLPPSQS